ncbi:hypothetical protein BJX99DRAFT_264138 [Aspergillus californicus]
MAKVDAVDGESASFPAPVQGPVEARSLSSITSIASNPPAYPRNPAHKKIDPLVLYIVRVPGSKDVFLSPLKPPTKASVSAEAINASLYYLHVAGPDDDALLQEYEEECEEQARLRKEGLLDDDHDMPLPPPEFARMNNVRRKPVGGAKDMAGFDDAPALPARPPPPSHQQLENTSEPLVSDPLLPPMLPPRPSFSDASGPAEAMASLTGEVRPPIPPRPLPGVPRHEAFDSHGPPKKNHRWTAVSGYISNQVQRGRDRFDGHSPIRHSFDASRPQMRPHSSHDLPPPYSPTGSPTRSPAHSPSRRPRDSLPRRQPGFHITLIRRDPTHGIQWNVATMSNSPLDGNGSGIDIDISTPGYKRFTTQNEPLSLENLGLNLPAEARALLARHSNLTSHPDPAAASQDSSAPRDSSQSRRFHRKLAVSRPHNPDEARGSLDLSGGRPSMDSIPGSPSNLHTSSNSKLKSGYYTFNSPWNGICTFSTSVNGRSLKCKHMIPLPGFPNPTHATQENPAVTVAEIRFNTPFQTGHLSHNYHGTSHASPFTLSQTPLIRDPSLNHDPSAPYYYDPLAPPPSKRAAIASFINHNLSRRHSNSSSSSAGGNDPPPPPPPRPPRVPPSDDRIDLSLAREKAGGGMRGNSAKLGKLIIEDEGIKMLDLTVAACMAVWWRGYY